MIHLDDVDTCPTQADLKDLLTCLDALICIVSRAGRSIRALFPPSQKVAGIERIIHKFCINNRIFIRSFSLFPELSGAIR